MSRNVRAATSLDCRMNLHTRHTRRRHQVPIYRLQCTGRLLRLTTTTTMVMQYDTTIMNPWYTMTSTRPSTTITHIMYSVYYIPIYTAQRLRSNKIIYYYTGKCICYSPYKRHLHSKKYCSAFIIMYNMEKITITICQYDIHIACVIIVYNIHVSYYINIYNFYIEGIQPI